MAAVGECEQPERGNRFGPAGFIRSERAPKPGQLFCVEKVGKLLPQVLRDPETGDDSRSQNSHSSARHIIECRISRVQCAAPIQFLLALSSPVATPSEPVRSRGILPNAGTMQASRLMRMVLRSEGFQCGSQLRMYSAANSRKVGGCFSCRMSSSGFTPAQIRPRPDSGTAARLDKANFAMPRDDDAPFPSFNAEPVEGEFSG